MTEQVIEILKEWANKEANNDFPNNEWCKGFAEGHNMAKQYVKSILQFTNQHETTSQNPTGVKVS